MLPAWLLPLASPVLGGGLLFGLMKLRPERDMLVVQSARSAVELIAQSSTHLATELAEARIRITELDAELRTLRVELQQARAMLDAAERAATA